MENMFSPDELVEIMGHMSKFIENVICLASKTGICLQRLLNITKSLSVRIKLKTSSRVVNYSHFLQKSANLIHTPSVSLTSNIARILKFFSNQEIGIHFSRPSKVTMVTVLFAIQLLAVLILVEGSAEHTLIVEKQKAYWAKIANEFANGKHSIQLHAKAKLEEMGYKKCQCNGSQ